MPLWAGLKSMVIILVDKLVYRNLISDDQCVTIVVHVGVFTLQATTDLSTATETFIRWKPALSATDV